MDQQLVALLEKLTASLNGSGKPNGNHEPAPSSAVLDPAVHPAPSADGGNPLHRQIPREEGTESVIWDYGEIVTDGYRGEDGGAISDTSSVLLMPPDILRGTEAVIAVDDRTKVANSHEYPWRMIASLEIQMRGHVIRHGTGFMVGPTTVLTAGHCVYEPRYGGWAQRIGIRPGLCGPNQPFGTITSTRMTAALGWIDLQDHTYDYAFIELEAPVGRSTGWFSLGVLPAQTLFTSTINVCGYPTDVNDHLLYQWHSGGRLGAVETQKLYYEADTFGGTSGGPIWISRTDGTQMVVGVHAYGTQPSAHLDTPHNSGTRIVPEIVHHLGF